MTDLRTRVVQASEHSSDRWLLAWALGYAAIGASTLLVPLYALALGGGPMIAGLLEASAGLAGVPGAILWGRLADRTGRRRGFVLFALAGSGLAFAVFPLLDALWTLLALNAALWFVVSAATPVVTLFMIEGHPEAAWDGRVGRLNAAQRYGWVGGLVAGTVWLGLASASQSVLWAQRTFFLVCAVGALVSVPLTVYWLPPEATGSPRRLSRSRAFQRVVSGSGRYVKVIPFATARAALAVGQGRRGRFGRLPGVLRRYLLIVFVFSTGFATLFGPVPAYLADLSLSSATIFAVFIVSSLASAVVFVPVGRATQRWGAPRLQTVALGTRVLLFPALGLVALLGAFSLRLALVGLAFAVIGLTWAVIVVTAVGITTRVATPAVRGEALGLYTAVSGLGGGLGGVMGGVVAGQVGYLAAFGLAGGIVACALAGLVWLRRTQLAYRSST